MSVQLWSVVSTLQSPVTRLTSAEERLGSRVASRYAGLAEKRAGEADTTVTNEVLTLQMKIRI